MVKMMVMLLVQMVVGLLWPTPPLSARSPLAAPVAAACRASRPEWPRCPARRRPWRGGRPGGSADLGWDGWDVSRYGPGLDRGQDHALGWDGSSLVGSSQACAALGSSDGANDDGGGGVGEEWRCWQAEVAGVGSAAQRPAFVRG